MAHGNLEDEDSEGREAMRKLFTEEELNGLVRDIDLSKKAAQFTFKRRKKNLH